MEWKALRDEWQQSQAGEAPGLHREPEALWRRVRRRDRLETLVAALLVPVFGFAAWRALSVGRWLEFGFALLLVAVIAYIPLHLWRARRSIPAADPARPVREYLEQSRAAAASQATMMRSVAWWYSGPIAVGVIGFVGASRGFDAHWLTYAAIVGAVTLGLNWINARAADRVFDAAARDIEHQLRELEEVH